MTDAEPSPTPDAFRSHLIALVSAYQLGPTSGVPVPRYDGTRDWQTETILVCLSEFARRMWAAEETVVRLQKEARRRDRRRARGKRISVNGSVEDESWDECNSLGDSDSENETVVLRGTPRHEYEPSLVKGNGHGGYGYVNGLSLRDVNRDHYHTHSHHNKNANNLSPKPTVTTTTGAGGTFQVSCPTCGRCWIYPPSSTSATTGASPTPTGENTAAVESDPVLMDLLPPGPAIPAISDSGLSIEEENVWLRALVVDAARVCGAVSKGDLNQKITAPAKGSAMTNLKEIINVMVDKLGQFSDEVTRVSQEVGTEGKLGGQAVVMDVEGTWRQLTGVVNNLAANLTAQVRSIAKVTKAVALGDLSKQIEVEARGEILDLKNTVNGMVIRFVFVVALY